MRSLLFISCWLSASIGFAQYQPLAVEGAQWIQFYTQDGDPAHQNYFIVGDSLIDGINYKRIYQRALANDATSPTDLVPPYQIIGVPYLVGLVRDDTTPQRVYGGPWFDGPMCTTPQGLLYDFTQMAGDTIAGCYNQWTNARIDSVGSTIWNGIERHTLYTNYLEEDIRFIEGIGGDYGPISTLMSPPAIPGNFVIQLVDYCIGTDVECGLEPTSTQNAANPIGLYVYPNPSNGETLFVGANVNCAERLQATLYDALGRRVWQSASAGCADFPLKIPTAGLGEGAYYLTLRGVFGVATRRVVVR